MSNVKELNSWCIGGNIFQAEKGCRLSLYNEDDAGNETDSVVIHLTPKRVRDMVRVLEMYLIEEGDTDV